MSVVEVGQGRESIFFFSGYVQPNTGVGCAEIGRALRAVGGGHQKCLGMDGNGHSQVWGPSSVITNPQGLLLENLLASEEMISINAPDSAPTYTGDDGRHSWIDVSAVSVELLDHVSHWQVVEGAGLGSDHALISWELLVQSPPAPIRRCFNWTSVD